MHDDHYYNNEDFWLKIQYTDYLKHSHTHKKKKQLNSFNQEKIQKIRKKKTH